MQEVKKILEFWFGRPDSPNYSSKRKRWFEKNLEFDLVIRRDFMVIHDQAATGALASWREAVAPCMALILLLDQFPRNMFREDARAFVSDSIARDTAHDALVRGHDEQVPPVHRMFFYLPFEHSEEIADQQRSVELFSHCETYPGSDEVLEYAHRHFRVIERFGRFPHRNAVLGRISTEEEIAFLTENEKGF